ncbi:hypothetical protein M4951_02750 [Blastopirellula sp. J2-11]|uniref:hypothetical protein n=1 Tax=Blastopirellula sp. J2-11 TaxID=2943192 RepID=UPI0021C7481E|nr:hypothetical protein [Blastopirellula sp. J2-11]UUO07236.1 hypothetical protein M4951_02750 [Blastopirellula sp. J2-11]
MLLNLQKLFGAVTLLGASFVTTSLVQADHAPHPSKPPKDQRDFIFRDFKGPPIRPKSSAMPRPFGLSGSKAPMVKDAPKPSDSPKDWRSDYVLDFKPPVRPKGSTSSLGLRRSQTPRAKDAPKPTDPPKDWRKYVNGDYKPKPRPKPSMSPTKFGLSVPHNPAAKDAPKPKDPPSKWRKYIFEDIKAPTPRPKRQIPPTHYDAVLGRPKKIGFPPPTTLPSHKPGPTFPNPKDIKRPPYTHPPRDIRGPRGPLN